MRRLLRCLPILLACAFAGSAGAADTRVTTPVAQVAATFLDIPYAGGVATFPVYLSADWTRPQPGITRAVLVFHGLLRNAGAYFASALNARNAAGEAGSHAIIIAPQFLADFDIPAHALPANTLGWRWNRWPVGMPATRPAPLSGFNAIDAILSRLANRTIFPDLNTIVIAGFSAGGQIVHRYAVVGHETPFMPAGVAIRYIVSDPSSYLYFTPDRIDASGKLAPFASAAACPGWNDWQYGFAAGLPPYVTGTPAALERRYAQRDVIYLLGMADTDPNHPVLDKSCAAEAQGPQRFARGHAYFAAMQARDGANLRQHLIDVPGIAHDGNRMFTSACGLFALFDRPGCLEAGGAWRRN
jgi:hypothetical protein